MQQISLVRKRPNSVLLAGGAAKLAKPPKGVAKQYNADQNSFSVARQRAKLLLVAANFETSKAARNCAAQAFTFSTVHRHRHDSPEIRISHLYHTLAGARPCVPHYGGFVQDRQVNLGQPGPQGRVLPVWRPPRSQFSQILL